MKILFTGGGTGGSITPLIAIYEQLKDKEKTEFFWIGGKEGIEKEIVKRYDIKYYPIASGKLRRYFSFKNFTDPFRIIRGFFQSIKILRKVRPNVIVSAGSYIAVPVAKAGKFLKIPILVHQQDIEIGLANKIMSRHAKKITISFEEIAKSFPKEKTIYTGNPVRKEIIDNADTQAIKEKYKLENLLNILIIGGGTGAADINQKIVENLEKLTQQSNIFHITGKGKKLDIPKDIKNINRYHQFEFVGKELFSMMKLSDLVVSRAGMSTLSELAVLGKPVVIIPIPKSHQEKNANIFYRNNAAIIYEQKHLKDSDFGKIIIDILNNKPKLENLSLNIKKMMPQDAAERIAKVVMDMALSS